MENKPLDPWNLLENTVSLAVELYTTLWKLDHGIVFAGWLVGSHPTLVISNSTQMSQSFPTMEELLRGPY